MTTRLSAALAVTGVLLLTACSGTGDGDPAADTTTEADGGEVAAEAPITPTEDPAESQVLDTQGIAYAVPETWETQQSPEDDGLFETSARGELADGVLSALNVVTVPTTETDAQTWVGEMRQLGEVHDEQTFTMPTLSTQGPITLIEMTYAIEGGTVRTWVLVFEHQDGRTYNVSFLGSDDTFDESRAAGLLGTLRDA